MGSSNKLTLSKGATRDLDHLSARLGLRPNIVCRLAIGKSLTYKESIKDFKRCDDFVDLRNVVPKEFNRFTLTGDDDDLYKIMIYQHEYEASGKKVTESQYFKGYYLKHLERGLNYLYNEYQKINSPVSFLKKLV